MLKQILGHSVYLLTRFVIWQDIVRSNAFMTAKITTSCHVSPCCLAEMYRFFLLNSLLHPLLLTVRLIGWYFCLLNQKLCNSIVNCDTSYHVDSAATIVVLL